MIEVNHFTTACCDETMGNHYFEGYTFANANDVETVLGLTTGQVTYFGVSGSGKKASIVGLYDIPTGGIAPVNSIYRDYWGLIDNIENGFASGQNGVEFYSRATQTVKHQAFNNLQNSQIAFDYVKFLGNTGTAKPFEGANNCTITLKRVVNLGAMAFNTMVDSEIIFHPTIKTIAGGGTDIFDTSTNCTVYASTELAAVSWFAASLAANPTITLVTY